MRVHGFTSRGPPGKVRPAAFLPVATVLSSLAVATVLAGCDLSPQEPGPDTTEILWDTFGVPHVYGETEQDLFFAHGWAQMEAHGDRLLRLYAESRGAAARYWGEDRLEHDRLLHTLGLPALGEAWYAAQEGRTRSNTEAFARGINAYAERHREHLGADLSPILPVEPSDVFRHAARLLVGDFVLHGWHDMAGRWREGSGEGGRQDPAPGADPVTHLFADSNTWAIGPGLSTSGNALLLANSQLPWDGRHTLFEVHLVGPGVDVHGATVLGLPAPMIAFNDHLGWTHTVDGKRGWDLYEIELQGGGYRFEGEIRPLQIDTVILQVKGEGSDLRSDTLRVRRTVHGPLVDRLGRRALALQHGGLELSGTLGHWWSMAGAGSLEEFESVLALAPSPGLTTTYADREGNILRHAGAIQMPRSLNPREGWVHATHRPEWATGGADGTDTSDALADLPREDELPLRAQRSIELMSEGPMTLAEWVDRKHSTRLLLADRVLPDLLPAAAEASDPLLSRAATVLDEWDRTADAGSAGAVLFHAWAEAWFQRAASSREPDERGTPFAAPWSPDEAAGSPRGIGDIGTALQVLAGVAHELEGRGVALDIQWGDVHRFRRDTLDLPGSGAPAALGGVRAAEYDSGDDGRMEIVAGGNYVVAVEFSDPVNVWALMAYGNASQEGSPHRTDQLELFARQELRPVWRTREEIERNLIRRTTF